MSHLPTPLLLPDPAISIDAVELRDARCLVTAHATAPDAACPSCACRSSIVHSHSTRHLADTPCAGYPTTLVLRIRRFRCGNPACPRRIFAERLPDLTPAFARRTPRLAALLQRLALTLASTSGAPLLQRCGMPVSPSTLLRLQRQVPLPTPPPPTIIGIDDCALRRGHTYATLMVDLERRTPIAVLPDREATTVAAWLKQHPQVTTIARDRAGAYADAASAGAPHAIQVADVWHLTKSVGEALQRALQRHPAVIRQAARACQEGIPTALAPGGDVAAPPTMATLVPPADAVPAASLREQQFREALALHARGWSIRRIARTLHLNWHTVRRSVEARELPKRGGPVLHGPSTVTPFLQLLRAWIGAGSANASQRWRDLVARGYGGSLGSVSRALWHLRPADAPPSTTAAAATKRAYSPRQAMWLLIRETTGQLEGQINRVNVIKRVVYGRAKLDLLERRILCAS